MDSDNGNCPDCGKPFGKQKRCYTCHPRKGNGKVSAKAAKPAKTSGLAAAMTAAEEVKRAVWDLDLGTATDVLTFVLDRLE